MEHTHRRPHNQLKHPWLTYLLILFVPLAGFSIQVGFSLKPYMIFLIVVFFLYASSFIFDRLQPFEWTMLMFYFLYCFSGIFFQSTQRQVYELSLASFCIWDFTF